MGEASRDGRLMECGGVKYELVEDLTVKHKDKLKVLVWMNIIMFAGLVAIVVAGVFITHLIDPSAVFEFGLVSLLLILTSFAVYIFVHEFIHGLVFRLAGGVAWKDISYGASIKSGMAYCISDLPVNLRTSRISLIAPFIIVCVPIIVYSIAIGSLPMLIAGALFTTGSTGDFWYLWILRKRSADMFMLEEKPKNNEYTLGCYVLEKADS